MPQLGDPKLGKLSVIVDPRIPWQRQAELAKFVVKPNNLKVSPWVDRYASKPEVSNGHVKAPYIIQIDDGTAAKEKTWESVYEERLKRDDNKEKGGFKAERGATIAEGIALVIAHPEILDTMRVALPGSASDLYDIIQIQKIDGKVVISPLFVGDTNTDHGTPDKEVNGKVIKGRIHYRDPFSLLFVTREKPQPKAA